MKVEGEGEGIVGKKSRTGRGGNRWKIPGDFGRRGGGGGGGGERSPVLLYRRR